MTVAAMTPEYLKHVAESLSPDAQALLSIFSGGSARSMNDLDVALVPSLARQPTGPERSGRWDVAQREVRQRVRAALTELLSFQLVDPRDEISSSWFARTATGATVATYLYHNR